jgi:lipid A 4'-phosphatase
MNATRILKSRPFKDFAIILGLLGLITLVFNITDLDISLQHLFYNQEKGWILQNRPLWNFLYKFGIYPGYFFALIALIMISLSYWSSKYIKYRKACILLVFTLIAGPGVIVNGVLKDHAGRPRPREITEFGGTEKFLCVCQVGDNNQAKSFPCGHCSMGFYMAVPYLFLRYRRRFLAWTFLIGGTTYGILMGIARMMAGGHFASDVLWSGGIVWLVALTGLYLFKTDRPVEMPHLSEEKQKRKARIATLIIGIILPVVTAGLMLATPYISKKSMKISNADLEKTQCRLFDIDLKDATVIIAADTCFHIEYKVNAFGFPNSRIGGELTPGEITRYTINYSGWFTEIKNVIDVHYPVGYPCSYNIRINRGKALFNFADGGIANIKISIKKGDIILNIDPEKVDLIGDSSKIVNQTSKRITCFSSRPPASVHRTIEFEVPGGKVNIK